MTTSWYRLVVLFFGAVILTACGGSESADVSSSGPASAPMSFAMPQSSYGAPSLNGIEGTGSCTPACTSGSNPPTRMATARAEHSATLLRDGRVLIAGGFDIRGNGLASAELYDPASGTFTPTGDMTAARARHTATLLANGKVLIAGGQTVRVPPGLLLDSAEIYDPSTGVFTATSKMIFGCSYECLSTLLPDGRVFIPTVGNAETYDPHSGSFALTGPYQSQSYVLYSLTSLQDGRVLVVGVVDSVGTAGTTQLFDPITNTFSSTGSRACPDCGSTATLLPDGEVFFDESSEAEIYNPASGAFINLGNIGPDTRTCSTATLLGDGAVLIVGGEVPGTGMVNVVDNTAIVNVPGNTAIELYTPATHTFTPAASLSTGRYCHTATLLADNSTVLIAGGYIAWQQPTASAELFVSRH